MNEKAIECMSSTKDEPETALEYLKKVNDTLDKVESSENPLDNQIDPNYKMTLYYNIATCYQRLGMLEECVDFLEMATKSLNQKIAMLEEEENALIFQTATSGDS